MDDKINAIKAAITAVCAALTALWGWFGWLCLLWLGVMALDYATGSAAAMRAGEWSSKAARDGIWHKMGEIVAVLVAGVLDLLIGVILTNIPGLSLPFEYKVFFAPVVVVWYILTECGSIVENIGGLGSDVPKWLAKAFAALQDKVDDTMDIKDKSDT